MQKTLKGSTLADTCKVFEWVDEWGGVNMEVCFFFVLCLMLHAAKPFDRPMLQSCRANAASVASSARAEAAGGLLRAAVLKLSGT